MLLSFIIFRTALDVSLTSRDKTDVSLNLLTDGGENLKNSGQLHKTLNVYIWCFCIKHKS